MKFNAVYPDGLYLDSSMQKMTYLYHPGNKSFSSNERDKLSISVYNILGKKEQFEKLVNVWKDSIDELKLASKISLKTTDDGLVTRELCEISEDGVDTYSQNR